MISQLTKLNTIIYLRTYNSDTKYATANYLYQENLNLMIICKRPAEDKYNRSTRDYLV